jgi:hypothetical protein
MRAPVLVLAALLALPAAAGAQQRWAKNYQDAIKAFESQNYALAEQKFKEARDDSQAPEQSRNANFSSVVFRPFVPDLYLGVIAARLGRHSEAKATLERVLRDPKQVTERERKEFALATGALEDARVALAKTEKPETRLAENRPVNPPPTNTPSQPPTTTPTTQPSQQPTSTTVTPPPIRNTPPPVTPNTEAWRPGFTRQMDAARASLKQNRYAEARVSASGALSVAGDGTSRLAAESLRREIDSAQNTAAQQIVASVRDAIRRKDAVAAATQLSSLETLAPGHGSISDLQRQIEGLTAGLDRVARLAGVERVGVRLFLSGNYKEAAAGLEKAVNDKLTSPRVYLFLASSRAAQALLAPQAERRELEAAARRHYALAKPNVGSLAADQKFISPSILSLLNGS